MTISALKDAIVSTINNDATYSALNTGGTHAPLAPPGVSTPYTTYRISWQDDYAMNGEIRTIYQVDISCWTEDLDDTDIATMADRLHALLTDGTFTVSGKTTLYIRRISGDGNVETFGTDVFQNFTSTFQIELS